MSPPIHLIVSAEETRPIRALGSTGTSRDDAGLHAGVGAHGQAVVSTGTAHELAEQRTSAFTLVEAEHLEGRV